MFRLIKRLLCSLLFFMMLKSAVAMVTLPAVLSDHMVLQNFSWVNLWGTADPGESISVFTSWNGKTYQIQADASGKWKVKLFSGGPGGPYTITFNGKNKVELKDVMVGEVWLCSGQSNMEFTFRSLGGWKYYTSLKNRLDTSNLGKIRLCTVGKHVAQTPSDSCAAGWMPADTASVLDFSATAFYFGLEIFKKFRVPVGLIVSSWGGSPAEAWTPAEYLKYTPGLSMYLDHPNNPSADFTAPSVLFNGMIHPVKNYTVKGCIWYQGESNRYDADLYASLFMTMIRSWRKYMEQPELPFYYVQIAPFDYADFDEASGFLREAQEKALRLEHTGMAVTLDIGDLRDIHPKNKEEVGHRLALLAFAKSYGQPALRSSAGPAYRFARADGDRIQVYFKDSDMLYGKGDGLSGFRIAGTDGEFRPARALITGNSVTVWNDSIKSPQFVRYAFLNTDTASVFDRWGLPAGSFRTDTLPFNYRKAELFARYNPAGKNWKVGLRCADKNAVIHYTMNGSLPSAESAVYYDTITSDTSCSISAKAFLGNVPSFAVSGISLESHEALGSKVVFKARPAAKYMGNGYTLTDGIHGSRDFRDGRWLGFLGSDLEATMDLGREVEFSSAVLSYLVNTPAYIFPPTEAEVYISSNGKSFTRVFSVKLPPPDPSSLKSGAARQTIQTGNLQCKARYLKVIAKNQKSNPPWHYAPGEKCWLFVDEVEIRK